MTYSVGGLIQATDYNGFASTTAGGNVNVIWGTGSTDAGYGQSTTLATVSTGGTVTATQWASLVNRISSIASHTGTTITSRTAPVAGNVIAVLNAVQTDLNSCYTNRGNAAASGTTIGTFSGTTSKTSATGSGQSAWTITFTHTVTFASANAARYFFNAGGLVKIMYGKSSTGTDHDPDWNTLAGQCGSIFFSGRVNSTTNTIAGQAYTGTTRIGGTGGTQTTLATTTGFYSLTAGAAATTIFQLNNTTSPYTPEYIRTTVGLNAGSTVLTFTTTWVDDGSSGAGVSSNISGGTAVSSPATSIGGATAPTTLVNLVPPSTTHLTEASWGTPTIAAAVS
jgi:hypothetical protein